MICRRIASATIAPWRCTPSLYMAQASRLTTVPGAISNALAISLAVSPWATDSTNCSSRGARPRPRWPFHAPSTIVDSMMFTRLFSRCTRLPRCSSESVRETPRLATGDGLGLLHQICFVRWGGPAFRLLRGHIVGPAVRCLTRCWERPSGFPLHAGESLTCA